MNWRAVHRDVTLVRWRHIIQQQMLISDIALQQCQGMQGYFSPAFLHQVGPNYVHIRKQQSSVWNIIFFTFRGSIIMVYCLHVLVGSYYTCRYKHSRVHCVKIRSKSRYQWQGIHAREKLKCYIKGMPNTRRLLSKETSLLSIYRGHMALIPMRTASQSEPLFTRAS
jgi:hypothetical protein